MLVELKKVKITKSVVDQSLLGSSYLYFGHPNYNILGWCVTRRKGSMLRYILLYDKLANTVVRLRHVVSVKDIMMEKTNFQEPVVGGGYTYTTRYVIKVHCQDFNNTHIIRTQSPHESDKVMEEAFVHLRDFIKAVNSAGQIYI